MADTTATVEKTPTEETDRASVSVPREHYNILASVAEQDRASVAWNVRDAITRYVEDRWPLLRV